MNRIHELIAGHPADATALVLEDGRSVTYGTLRQTAEALAAALARHGIRPGDRLLIVAENGLHYAAAVFAASQAGAWATLVNARQTAEEVDATARAAEARAVLFTTDTSEPARAHAARLGAVELGQTAAGPLAITPLREARPEPMTGTAEDIAALLYTTGTTSAPKGVMLSHGNLVFNARSSGAAAHLGPDDDVLCVLPGTHIYALASVFLPTLAYGGRIRFLTRFAVEPVLDALAQGVTRFPGVPQMFAAITAHLEATGAALAAPRLRAIATGGAPLDPGLKERTEATFGLPLLNGYGMTETAPSIAATRSEAPRADLSVGFPYDGIEVAIHEPGPDGVGEIRVRGPNVMKGYYRDPARTAEVLTPDGWFCTGDLGRLGADGELYVVGRLKELIIRSGFNVYPPEVEGMLTRHPAVLHAAVVGRPVPGNEEIIAFVTLRGAAPEETLKAWLRERLVAYKVPQRIVIVDELPAAATGKYLKHKLLEMFADRL